MCSTPAEKDNAGSRCVRERMDWRGGGEVEEWGRKKDCVCDVTQAPPLVARGGRESPRIYELTRGRHLAASGPKLPTGGHYEPMIGWNTGGRRRANQTRAAAAAWLAASPFYTLVLFWKFLLCKLRAMILCERDKKFCAFTRSMR